MVFQRCTFNKSIPGLGIRYLAPEYPNRILYAANFKSGFNFLKKMIMILPHFPHQSNRAINNNYFIGLW